MTLEDFVNKWVCPESLKMSGKEGTISFQGLNCIIKFKNQDVGSRDHIFAINLVNFDAKDFEKALSDVDSEMTKIYKLEE